MRFSLKRAVVSSAVATIAAISAGQPAFAQATPPDSSFKCDGIVVDSVEVETYRPAFKGAMGWWRRFARVLGLHHETTNAGLVRRFVSLDPGLHCSEFRRSESERILRAQPYLADATVATTRVGDSVRVNVSTVDEVAVVAGARIHGTSLAAVNMGTMNFLGAGMHVEGRWEDGRARRDGYGARIAHYQLFGRPYAIEFDGMRHPIGEIYSASLSHPLLTDLQRVAWHSGYSTSKDFAHLRRPDRSELLQPLDRATYDVGGVLRFGPARRLIFAGAMLLGQRFVPRSSWFLVDSTSNQFIPAADTAGVRQYPAVDATYVAGVLGLRALTYTRMPGLDAVAAAQDVGTGAQISALFGVRPLYQDVLQDGVAAFDAYAAGRTRRSFAGARAEVESRLNLRDGEWRHLIASGRAAWYFKPLPQWTSVVSLEGAGGWRTVLPFQLELGDRETGVRGYARSLEAGSQRLLLRLEQRADLARYRVTRAAIGASVFADAGRIWSGDVPFGQNTPVRTSVGVALLAAVPANSQRTMRAELAIPLMREQGARPELRFVVREPARGFWSEPAIIRWARLSAVPEQIFSWP